MSNTLYAPYNMFASSNVTSCLVHVTSPIGAKHLIFPRIVKNRDVFHEFYARFFMNAHFSYLLTFSVEIALVLACTQGQAHDVPYEASTLIGQFLNSGT